MPLTSRAPRKRGKIGLASRPKIGKRCSTARPIPVSGAML